MEKVIETVHEGAYEVVSDSIKMAVLNRALTHGCVHTSKPLRFLNDVVAHCDWTNLLRHTSTFHLLVKICDLLCTQAQICNKYKHLRNEKKKKLLSNTNQQSQGKVWLV